MFQLPPIFAWDAVHPVVVHFPIALLMTVPLFVVLALLLRPVPRRAFLAAALLLMVLGTAGTFLAVATGDAAEERAESLPGVETVLEAHEELGERARLAFTALTVAFAALLLGPTLLRKPMSRRLESVLVAGYLVFYLGGIALLADTAHQGGRLVHELGVQALSSSSTGVSAGASLVHDDD